MANLCCIKCLYAFIRPDWLSEALNLGLSVHSSVCLSVTKLVNKIIWKRMNQFWSKPAQVIHMARAWSSQLWGSGGQRSRSHEAEIGQKNPLRCDFLRTNRQILTKLGSCVFFKFPCIYFYSEAAEDTLWGWCFSRSRWGGKRHAAEV